ncbi:MAG: alpha/beta fold hydrolase [Gemmatimonadota bacterium]
MSGLEFERREGAPGAPVLVLLHGRGADRHDLMGLVPYLPKEWSVLAPDAPHAGAPWGYGPGRAWYRFLGGRAPEPEGFRESLLALSGFLKAARAETAGPVVLGGFSQGGTVSLAYALAHAGGQLPAGAPSVDAVAVLSGFLAEHPDVPAGNPGVPVFWGHGRQDPAIPLDWGEAGRAVLLEAGVQLTDHDYDIGHWIDGQEMADLVAWVERLGARGANGGDGGGTGGAKA